MSRKLSTRQAALAAALLAFAAATLLGCSGGGDDPASPPQATGRDTYFRATITALDTGSPCRPGIACDPEFYSCDGSQGFTVPSEWTVRATQANGGAIAHTSYVPDQPGQPGQNARAFILLSATDTSHDTSIGLGLAIDIDRNTGAVYVAMGDGTSTFANIDGSCTEINSAFDPVTLFQLDGSQPFDLQLTGIPIRNLDIDFARPSGANLTDSFIEGTFDFVGKNRQELGRIYIGSVRVQGCFRLHLTDLESALPVLAQPPSPACN